MLALLFLFLLWLAVILARSLDSGRKQTKGARETKLPTTTPTAFLLRLLQGDTRVWLKEMKGESVLDPGKTIQVHGLLTIGRAPGNDIRLEDPFASAFHARIRITRQGPVIEDLGTTNGTRVNGVRISGPVRIEPGDIIDVGSTSLAVEE